MVNKQGNYILEEYKTNWGTIVNNIVEMNKHKLKEK